MILTSRLKLFALVSAMLTGFVAICTSGCSYGFSAAGGNIPDSIRTIHIKFIENRAPYVNPEISPALTDRLRRKINNQTRLKQTQDEQADYLVESVITDYSVSTSGVSSTPRNDGTIQSTINNLNVRVHVKLTNTLRDTVLRDFDATRAFPFSADLSLQQAESQLRNDIMNNLSDEIFNNLFSDW